VVRLRGRKLSLYPVTGASIAHNLLARGLKTCLGFKDDSMASDLAYIASVNASASQLSHVQPMTVRPVRIGGSGGQGPAEMPGAG
jgi:hypothetical protein